MRILLTRPLKDSLVTAKFLNEKHIEAVVEPLFEINACDLKIPEQDFQALIFTSRHAVNIFAQYSVIRNVAAYCVGDQTAAAAKENNFTNVISADGDEENLLTLIKSTIPKESGKLLRLTGYKHDDLSDQLRKTGYDVTSLQVYEVIDHDTLSTGTIDLLSSQKLDGIVFFSPKTVSRFYTLVHKHELAASCRNMTAWCISGKAAQSLGDLEFRKVAIAEKPTQKALLELISKERKMFTDEEMPPLPKFKVTKWLLSGLMAWSLFFGIVGGLGVLLLVDFGPEKISPTRQLKENVATVDSRVAVLEQRTQKLHDQQKQIQQSPQQSSGQQQDSQLTKILIGLTQLKTAYDNEAPLDDAITTLKSVVKNSGIQQNLTDLQKLTADNFPSKEKILDDLQALQNSSGSTLKNEKGEQPLDWKSRTKMALGQLVRVTPTKNIIQNKDIERVEQAVAGGDYDLAHKFASALPNTSSTQMITSEITTRVQAGNLVQKIVSQIGSAIGTNTGSLY